MVIAAPNSDSGFLRKVAKGLLSPWMIACYFAICTLPYWASAIVYLMLRTYFLAPSGLVPWSLIIVTGFIAIWAFVSYFIELARMGRQLRDAKVGADHGDQEAAQKFAELRSAPMPVRGMAIGFLAVKLLIPLCVGLMVGNNIVSSPNFVRSDGKLRRETPRESLGNFLKVMESKGIFNVLGD